LVAELPWPPRRAWELAARAGPRRCWELAELRGALLTIGGLRRTWRVIPGRGITSHCRRVGDDRDRVALAVVGGAGRAVVVLPAAPCHVHRAAGRTCCIPTVAYQPLHTNRLRGERPALTAVWITGRSPSNLCCGCGPERLARPRASHSGPRLGARVNRSESARAAP
jgi:hypothetical protein